MTHSCKGGNWDAETLRDQLKVAQPVEELSWEPTVFCSTGCPTTVVKKKVFVKKKKKERKKIMSNRIPSDHLGWMGEGLAWEKRHQFVQKNCFWQETKGYCSVVLKKGLDFWPPAHLVPWKTNRKEALTIQSNTVKYTSGGMILWFRIENIYLVFILVSGIAPKTLGIS